MAKFINTEEITSGIRRIISEGKKLIVLISPYLKVTEKELELMEKAVNNGVTIKFITRALSITDTDEQRKKRRYQEDKLRQVKCQLYFCRNLHAKCYFNEWEMIICSLNLHQYSEENNYEMGMLLNCRDEDDIPQYQAALRYVNEICENAGMMEGDEQEYTGIKTKHIGFCIHCGKKIPYSYDYDRPKFYCKECWKEWYNDDGSKDTKEYFCHQCGKRFRTTFNKPLCNKCVWELVRIAL